MKHFFAVLAILKGTEFPFSLDGRKRRRKVLNKHISPHNCIITGHNWTKTRAKLPSILHHVNARYVPSSTVEELYQPIVNANQNVLLFSVINWTNVDRLPFRGHDVFTPWGGNGTLSLTLSHRQNGIRPSKNGNGGRPDYN